jgi:RNA polymerase sigma-70 factor (ECF subfamily)
MLSFLLSFLRRGAGAGSRLAAAPEAAAAPASLAAESPAATVAELSPVDLAMHRYAEGETAAFGEVHGALAPRLRLFLRRLGCSLDIAEDLTQETFLRMHHARGSFARGKHVAPWAYAIARNCFISHARSSKTKLSRASVDAEQVELPARSSSGEDETIARQSAEVVQRALLTMTPARREAFVLLRYEGMSVAAAAQIVGISEGALKIRAFHAYELLRAALAGLEDPSAPGADGGNRLAVET